MAVGIDQCGAFSCSLYISFECLVVHRGGRPHPGRQAGGDDAVALLLPLKAAFAATTVFFSLDDIML